MPVVKQERTGWRDSDLSARHRRWGWDCPAVDLDFLLLEYDKGKAIALIEYKHEDAMPQYATHPTYQALNDLGNRAGVPVFVVRYKRDFSFWTVIPLNLDAKKLIGHRINMTEEEWVSFLYNIRGYNLPKGMFDSEGILI